MNDKEINEICANGKTECGPKDKEKCVDEERRRELEIKIRKRVFHEEKAFRIVEELVEKDKVNEEYMKEMCKFIDQVMYEDIVEERAIAKVCGYPVCGNLLTSVKKQKYHINTKSNQVYDITDRKRYCSGSCYKASKYFQQQIPTSPVWAREDEETPNFVLLKLSEKARGSEGVCVLDHPSSHILQELKELETVDNLQTRPDVESKEVVTQDEEDEGQDITTVDKLVSQLQEIYLINPEDDKESSECDSDGTLSQTTGAAELPDKSDQVENMYQSSPYYGSNQKQQAVSANQHKNVTTQELLERLSAPDVPYSAREYSERSIGHVNRAVYYGYDQKQQALKAALVKEVASEGIKKEQQSFEGHHNYGQGEAQCKANVGYGVGQKSQAQRTAVNKDFVTQQLHKNEISMCSKANDASDLCTPLTLQIPVEQCEIPSKNKSHSVELHKRDDNMQDKAAYLMHLLDQRDALKQKLKAAQGGENHSGVISDNLLSNAKLHANRPGAEDTKSQITVCDTPNESVTSESSVQEGFHGKSSRVLENVHRLTQQAHSSQNGNDSDDEDDIPTDHVPPNLKGVSVSENVEWSLGNSTVVGNSTKVGSVPQAHNKGPEKSPDAKVTPMDLMKNILMEWKTVETRQFFQVGKKNRSQTAEKEVFNRKYDALSRRVDAQIRENSHLLDDEQQKTHPSKKLPDYKQLEKETQLYDYKIQEFYKGGTKLPVDIEYKECPENTQCHVGQVTGSGLERKDELGGTETRKKKLIDHEESGSSVYDRREFITKKDIQLPYVDNNSQIALRRKIVLDKLNKVLPDLLGPLKLSVREVSSEVKQLVHTFNFTSKNIVLKPAEWTLMGYLLLKMLSRKVKVLREGFRKDYATHFYNTMLLSVGATPEAVKQLVQHLVKQ